ncbi:hypothetical protein LTR53_014121 [Teratosphaeriaceae sp. CCFEE 6253]|nr:hypothetical protein LTR53_014121 [Teratosphaeriaceae sp. CCFEE 6253]
MAHALAACERSAATQLGGRSLERLDDLDTPNWDTPACVMVAAPRLGPRTTLQLPKLGYSVVDDTASWPAWERRCKVIYFVLKTALECDVSISVHRIIMMRVHLWSRLAQSTKPHITLGTSRSMATVRSSIPHEARTAAEPREPRLEPVILSQIRDVNPSVRLLRFNAVDPSHTIHFLPGQWLDTFIPGIPKAGGFTITSTPAEARPTSHSPPYLELAIQRSKNPPAQWLWKPRDDILGAQLVVRVGGSFVWPPSRLDETKIDRLVFVAGGVGINPLISIFAHLIRLPSSARPREMHFLYMTKTSPDSNGEIDPQGILFLTRLMDLVAATAEPLAVTLSLFLTDPAAAASASDDRGIIEHGRLPNRTFGRRIEAADLVAALDGFPAKSRAGSRQPFGREHDRRGTVCYVCGPPVMTDDYVRFLGQQEGMESRRVLCEKWW